MLVFLTIFFAAIIFLFAVHFGVLDLTRHYYSTPTTLLKNNRWEIMALRNPSLMISFNHFTEYTTGNYYETAFARMIHLNIGGFSIIYHYGHKFADTDTSYSFGFMSIDGEYFWKTIYIGADFIDNPFAFNQLSGDFIYDASENRLLDKHTLDEHYLYDTNHYPLFLVLENHPYNNAGGETQNVELINFYIEEVRRSSPFFKFLHLDKLFYKTSTSMMFNVVKGHGLGADKDVVQGEAFRISSSLTLNDLYKSMKKFPHKTPHFGAIFRNRIFAWMHTTRRF